MPPTPNGLSMPDTIRLDASRSRVTGTRAGCVDHTSLFQDPLLEEPPLANAPAGTRHRYAQLVRQAQDVCQSCPLLAPCLYRAVVEHDVAGFTAGTTVRQRHEIRRRLVVSVEPEDFDTLAGVTGRHRQIDHDEVVRLRHTNPHESLEALSHRLGCSLSTVKRHLRRERSTPSDGSRATVAPSLDEVVTVANEVTVGRTLRRSAAAAAA